MISRSEFRFDYDHAHGWCWRSKRRGSNEDVLVATAVLAEYAIKRLFDLHEEFKSGKKVRWRESGEYKATGELDWMR